MLQSESRLQGLKLHAEDGEIGSVAEVYLEDGAWVVRYFVVSTGSWLAGKKVLISPAAVRAVDWNEGSLHVALTVDQVRQSPDVDTDKPVSRQYETELAAYYAWTPYWSGSTMPFMSLAEPNPVSPEQIASMQESGDPHLRSADELKGYHIEARNGAVGHVVDFVLRDDDWKVAFLMVDAGSWLHKRNVLLGPESIEAVDWAERRVRVSVTREAIEASPEFDSEFPVPDEYAERLLEHYRGTADSAPPPHDPQPSH